MADDALRSAERAFHTAGSFEAEQVWLEQRIRYGAARHVFLNPDGTFGNWLGVVVRHPTGVVYAQQCGGVQNLHRLVEGFYVPLGGAGFELPTPTPAELTALFHAGGRCVWPWDEGRTLGPKARAAIQATVGAIACWRTSARGTDERGCLELDLARLEEVAEAWIPVVTPMGPGVLLHTNCD